MVMDAGSAVEPVIDGDEEPCACEERDGRVSKTTFYVLVFRNRGSCVYPAYHLPGINAGRQVGLRKSLGGDFGEKLFTIILGFPTTFYQRAEILKFLHEASFSSGFMVSEDRRQAGISQETVLWRQRAVAGSRKRRQGTESV